MGMNVTSHAGVTILCPRMLAVLASCFSLRQPGH